METVPADWQRQDTSLDSGREDKAITKLYENHMVPSTINMYPLVHAQDGAREHATEVKHLTPMGRLEVTKGIHTGGRPENNICAKKKAQR